MDFATQARQVASEQAKQALESYLRPLLETRARAAAQWGKLRALEASGLAEAAFRASGRAAPPLSADAHGHRRAPGEAAESAQQAVDAAIAALRQGLQGRQTRAGDQLLAEGLYQLPQAIGAFEDAVSALERAERAREQDDAGRACSPTT